MTDETQSTEQVLSAKLAELGSRQRDLFSPELKAALKKEAMDWRYEGDYPAGRVDVLDTPNWTSTNCIQSTETGAGLREIRQTGVVFSKERGTGKVNGVRFETTLTRAYANKYPSEQLEDILYYVGLDEVATNYVRPAGKGLVEAGDANGKDVGQEIDKVIKAVHESLKPSPTPAV